MAEKKSQFSNRRVACFCCFVAKTLGRCKGTSLVADLAFPQISNFLPNRPRRPQRNTALSSLLVSSSSPTIAIFKYSIDAARKVTQAATRA